MIKFEEHKLPSCITVKTPVGFIYFRHGIPVNTDKWSDYCALYDDSYARLQENVIENHPNYVAIAVSARHSVVQYHLHEIMYSGEQFPE